MSAHSHMGRSETGQLLRPATPPRDRRKRPNGGIGFEQPAPSELKPAEPLPRTLTRAGTTGTRLRQCAPRGLRFDLVYLFEITVRSVARGMPLKRESRRQNAPERRSSRQAVLSLMCALVMVLATVAFGPAIAFQSADSPPVSAHIADANSKHCPSSEQHHDQSVTCAFAAGCAVFLPVPSIRLAQNNSASSALPSLAEEPRGQLPPPLIQPPELIVLL